jgi:hypothetical protein
MIVPHWLQVNMTILVRRCPSLTAAKGIRTVFVSSSYFTSFAAASGFSSNRRSAGGREDVQWQMCTCKACNWQVHG